MSILSRLHKAVNGIGGAVNAVVGIPLDIARAPFRDDEYDGIIGTLYGSVVNRGAQFLTNTVGPEGIGGQAIGSLPSYVRDPASSVLSPFLSGLESTYREGIAEPISTAYTVGSLGRAEHGPGLGALSEYLDPQTWKRAHHIAQTRSPGQAFALSQAHVDITDEADLAAYVGTDAYKQWSGVFDAASRFILDPTVIGGKAASALRTKYIVQPLHTAEDVERALSSSRLAKFQDAISTIKAEHGEGAAAVIRDRFFPDHDAGAAISTILAQAKTPEEQWLGIRSLLGDKTAENQLANIRARIHNPIASLNKRAEELAPTKAADYRYRGTTRDPDTALSLFDDERALVQSELDRYYAIDARAARMQDAFGAINVNPRARLIPGIPAIGEVRTNITRSDFYQDSVFAKPLHKVFDMVPQRLINLSDQTGDVHLDRLMGSAGLDRELRDNLRSQYMAVTDPSERQAIAYNIEHEAVTHLATQAGMTVDEVESVLNVAATHRGQALNEISKRVYDQRGHSVLKFEDEAGNWINRNLPVTITQDQTLFPLVDIDQVRAATTRIGQFRARHPSTNVPVELLESFHRLWKPSVLLRVGWPIRVVGDEQFRIFAKIGALSQMKNLLTGMRDYTTDYISAVRDTGLGSVRGAANKEARAGFGVRELEVNGYTMEGAFGTPTDLHHHVRQLVDSSDQFRQLTGNSESLMLRQLREAGENFKSILPDSPDYPAAYNWAVDRLSKNPIAKELLAGKSIDDVVDFLHSTPEGTDILRSNSVKAHNARNWATEVQEQIDHYTAGNQELADLMAAGNASHADLTRLVPDLSSQPFTHGEILNQATGEGFISRQWSSLIENTFEKLGRTPTNILSRNRYFDHVYRAEAERLVNLLDDGSLTQTQLRRIEARSREYALGETRNLLYDLAESSQLGRTLRFISPFYNAWQEVLTRWTGLAIENPAFIARARLIWQSPEKAGIVSIEDGQEYLTIPLPEWATDLRALRGVKTKNAVSFNKQSFNMVLQGLPGFGPAVQIPTNEIVKNRPELEDSVKSILPYGSTTDTLGLIMPATAKRAFSLAKGDEDRSYRNAQLRIYFDKVVDYNLGKRDTQPTWEEAKKETDAFYRLRTFASFTLPAAPTFLSPYQAYIDSFRQAQQRYSEDKSALSDGEGNIRTPDEWFLDTYGKEYFALTQAVSKSVDGIPPTIEKYEERKKYADLVEKYPELGGLIVGYDGAGEFSTAVYNAQLSTKLRPGSDKTQRESLSFEEAAADPDRRLGWIEYRRFMDLVESTRIQRGLPNLQVAGAKDLAAVKAAFTLSLSQKYPAWADDFNQTDKGKWDNKINALRVIADDPRLSQRPDIAGLREYLQVRDVVSAELAKRGKTKNGAKTLNASTNQDIAAAWHITTGSLIERNLAFSDLFYRHLENDPLGL